MSFNNEKILKYCKCCGKKIKMSFGGTRFCNKCSMYIRDLRTENHYLKRQLEERN